MFYITLIVCLIWIAIEIGEKNKSTFVEEDWSDPANIKVVTH